MAERIALRTGLVRRNPLWVGFLGIMTFGIYVSIWISRVSRDINREVEETVISEPLLGVTTSLSIALPLSILTLLGLEDVGPLAPFLALIILASAWYYPFMIVRARQALQYRTNTMAFGRGAFRPMHTYLFGIVYLQWRLNWHLKRGALKADSGRHE